MSTTETSSICLLASEVLLDADSWRKGWTTPDLKNYGDRIMDAETTEEDLQEVLRNTGKVLLAGHALRKERSRKNRILLEDATLDLMASVARVTIARAS